MVAIILQTKSFFIVLCVKHRKEIETLHRSQILLRDRSQIYLFNYFAKTKFSYLMRINTHRLDSAITKLSKSKDRMVISYSAQQIGCLISLFLL